MLIEFTVENYLSIKEPMTLSMIATSDNTLQENIIERENYRLVKSAAIYGSNASGKSNVLKALKYMRELILESHQNQRGDKTSVIPFKLDQETMNKPSKFEIIFIHDKIKYIYGFAVDSDKVVNEYLYSYQFNRKKTIFERGMKIPFYCTADRTKQNIIYETTLDNILYLSKATQSNYKPVHGAFDWFGNTLKCVLTDLQIPVNRFLGYTAFEISRNPAAKIKALNFLHEADIGIDDIITALNEEQVFDEEKNETVTQKIIDIKTKHIGRKSNKETYEVIFDLAEESSGTIRFLGLLGPIIDVIENGYVLVYDELDIILHPMLSRFIIKLFHSQNTNPHNAQLIFNSHDSTLLDNELFRRDQIWFTEKKNDGSTDLYSLSDFKPRKPRKKDNFQKHYIEGRYGAIPYIGKALFLSDKG